MVLTTSRSATTVFTSTASRWRRLSSKGTTGQARGMQHGGYLKMSGAPEVSAERVVGLLQSDYCDATTTQRDTAKNSTGWWWCEGRRMLAESVLRKIGVEPVAPNAEVSSK